ncbi:MAG: hypothetical protein ACXAEU_08315 [Candidatus Hodarchaeales archaeon]|jgi:hypothetical protein
MGSFQVGLMMGKNAFLVTIIYYLLDFIAVTGFWPQRSPLIILLQTLLVFTWLFIGRNVIYRFLPAHMLSGRTLVENNNGLAICFKVRQAPAQRLKDFFISLGRHDYAIMEQAGQTVLVFYPSKKSALASSKSIKDMLVRIFPGIELVEMGFEEILGLPPGTRMGGMVTGLAGEQVIFGDTLEYEQGKVLTIKEGLSASDPLSITSSLSKTVTSCNIELKAELLRFLSSYFRTPGGNSFVVGVAVGPELASNGKKRIESYVMFPEIESFSQLVTKGDELQSDLIDNSVMTADGEKVSINGYFTGIKDVKDGDDKQQLRRVMAEYVTSGLYNLPLVVLEHATMDLEAFIVDEDEPIVERDKIDIVLEQLKRVKINLVY